MACIGMQQTLLSQTHSIELQSGGIAATQSDQIQICGTLQAWIAQFCHPNTGLLFRHGGHNGNQAVAGTQIGNPGQAALKLPMSLFRLSTHLQLFNATQKLDGIGQTRRTRNTAIQQTGQIALAHGGVLNITQVFNKGTLAPQDKTCRQRMLGHFHDGLNGITEVGKIRFQAQAQQTVLRQARQQGLRLRCIAIQRQGMLFQPLGQARRQNRAL